MSHRYIKAPLHGHRYDIYYYHRYMNSRHITVTHAFMVSLFLSYGFSCILNVLVFHVPVFMLYDCFLLLIWIFPLLNMRAVDTRYVESHIYCSRYIVPVILFPFLVILFYAINRTLVQLSCYPYLSLIHI